MENNENINPFMQAAQYNQQKKKKSKTIAIAVIVIVLVLAIAAAAVAIVLVKNNKGSSSKQKSDSPDGAAKTYAENMFDKNGFEKYTKIMMLDDVYKEYKKDEEFEDDKDDHKDLIKYFKDENIKIKIKSVTKGKELSKKELKSAVAYFKQQADRWNVDVDVVIDKGYEFKIKSSVSYDGDTKTETQKICVVNIKGEGWKVIDKEADYLK